VFVTEALIVFPCPCVMGILEIAKSDVVLVDVRVQLLDGQQNVDSVPLTVRFRRR